MAGSMQESACTVRLGGFQGRRKIMAAISKPIKGFHIRSRSHYARADDPQEIMIGLYYPSGGCAAEFAIRWHRLHGSRPLTPRLEIYDDAWHAFFEMGELRALGDFTNKNADEQTIMDFLIAAGFNDMTSYEGPRPLKYVSPPPS
jgi:hypothetical protein